MNESSLVRRVGLYGGSFDPVHRGHLLVAQAALEEMRLDRLIFVPAAQSPFKPGLQPTSGFTRARMLRLALHGQNQTSVDDSEIRRGGISYSIDTIREWKSRFPLDEVFWLIGADHVPTLPQWREADELSRSIEFVVIPRPGRTDITLPKPWKLHQLRGWSLDVSSSEIRERVRTHLCTDHLVPEAVAQVIKSENLYGTMDCASP